METTPLYNIYDKQPWLSGNPTIEIDHGARRLVSHGYPVAVYNKDGSIRRLQDKCDEEMFRHIKEFVRQLEGVDIDPIDWLYRYQYYTDPYTPNMPDAVPQRFAQPGDRTKPYDYDMQSVLRPRARAAGLDR